MCIYLIIYLIGPVLVKDMQTRLSKKDVIFLVQIVEKRSETNDNWK